MDIWDTLFRDRRRTVTQYGGKTDEFKTLTEKDLEGKHCVYHHGIAIAQHGCGIYLCSQCLREQTKCPKCTGSLEKKKNELSSSESRETKYERL